MGYIAPITNYQYIQYAERVIGKGYDPYRFVAITRIKPTVNQQENDQPRHTGNPFYAINEKTPKIRNNQDWIEKQYSQITGIGRNFNKYA